MCLKSITPLACCSFVVSTDVIDRLTCCMLCVFSDCKEMDLEPVALDDDVADKLWERSFQLCHIPVPH